jgi:IS1 family transposase
MQVQKNYRRLRIAADRYKKGFTSFVCGDRSSQTGIKVKYGIKLKI